MCVRTKENPHEAPGSSRRDDEALGDTIAPRIAANATEKKKKSPVSSKKLTTALSLHRHFSPRPRTGMAQLQLLFPVPPLVPGPWAAEDTSCQSWHVHWEILNRKHPSHWAFFLHRNMPGSQLHRPHQSIASLLWFQHPNSRGREPPASQQAPGTAPPASVLLRLYCIITNDYCGNIAP